MERPVTRCDAPSGTLWCDHEPNRRPLLRVLNLRPTCRPCGGTRRIVHWNVTEHPPAEWTIQQFRMVITPKTSHPFVLHDRDSIYAASVDRAIASMGRHVLKTPVPLVETEASSASCGYPFEKGKQYLVYAAGSGRLYGTSVCSRTAPLAAAQNDVALLREHRDGRLRSRVFGTVSGVRPPTPDQRSADLKFIGIPSIRVTAVGPSVRKSTVTDREGHFVFLDLPPAVYRVQANGPPSDPRTQTKNVTLDRCGANAYFLFNLSPD